MKIVFLIAAISLSFQASNSQNITEVDVCVYGGTSAGVIAAYTAKKMNKSVLLIEPGKHLGGLTTGGLGFTDIGNKYAITGISREFYRRIGKHYGKFEQWIFEPSVAEKTILEYINTANVNVLYNYRLLDVKKEGTAIKSISIESSVNAVKYGNQIIKAKMFIDCSYEGDLMAKSGVSYIVGREANNEYGETFNGVQVMLKHQFPDGVDPYKIAGNPSSGLLWGISNEALAAIGSGDTKVQSYNFRICLTNKPANLIPIVQPPAYDSSRYELLIRYLQKRAAKNLNDYVLKMDLMPNGKTDINNNGPFSTDMIGMNYEFPEAGYDRRKQIQLAHELYIKGLIYFIGHDKRIPAHLQKEMLQWGYPKDEYADNGYWSPQMYVREARRMKGAYMMSQANCQGKLVVEDGVGMAAYTMDSHNTQRVVIDGMVKNEGDVQAGGFGPYPIAYRSIIPRQNECTNLLVPVCLSATHIAYGSIRMEPVFMVLAQSSAVAAVLAINGHTTVQQVDVKKLQQILQINPLANKSTAEILVDNDDSKNVSISGDWFKQSVGGYGPSMLIDSSNNVAEKSVKFTPAVVKSGKYKIYIYVPKLPKATSSINIEIFDGYKKIGKIINQYAIKVQGQTSGEWVEVGAYNLPAGKKAYLSITNKNANGAVVADAALFVPAFNSN